MYIKTCCNGACKLYQSSSGARTQIQSFEAERRATPCCYNATWLRGYNLSVDAGTIEQYKRLAEVWKAACDVIPNWHTARDGSQFVKIAVQD